MKKTKLSKEILTAIPTAIAPWLNLDRKELFIAQRMIAGHSLTEIAAAMKKTLQATHAVWKNLIKKSPVWSSIRTGMIGKGLGRKIDPDLHKVIQPPPVSIEEIMNAVKMVDPNRRASILVFVNSLKGSHNAA